MKFGYSGSVGRQLDPSLLLEDVVPALSDLSQSVKQNLKRLRDLDVDFQTGRLYIGIQRKKFKEYEEKMHSENLHGVLTFLPGVVRDEDSQSETLSNHSGDSCSRHASPKNQHSSLVPEGMFRDVSSFQLDAIREQFNKTGKAIAGKVQLSDKTLSLFDGVLTRLEKSLEHLPKEGSGRVGTSTAVNYNVKDGFKELNAFLEDFDEPPSIANRAPEPAPILATEVFTRAETLASPLPLSKPLDDVQPLLEESFCICKQPSYGEMIGCDNPNCKIEWFHLNCVQLSSPPEGKWYCSQCVLDAQSVEANLAQSNLNSEELLNSLSLQSLSFTSQGSSVVVGEPLQPLLVGSLSEITASQLNLPNPTCTVPMPSIMSAHNGMNLFLNSPRTLSRELHNQENICAKKQSGKPARKIGRPKKHVNVKTLKQI